MPRYGSGHENLQEQLRLLKAVGEGTTNLSAKEEVKARTSNKVSEADERQVRSKERLTALDREQAAVKERLIGVEEVEAAAADKTTAAIRRRTAAREAEAVAAVNQERAFRGARDPLFAQARGAVVGGQAPSQYQMRRDYGVGQARAQRLQDAVRAGYGPPVAPNAPLTAQNAVIAADVDKTAATKAYNAAIRRAAQAAEAGNLAARQSAEAAAVEAKAARDEAIARKQAATAQLESASSTRAAATSAKTEAAARDKVAAEMAGVPPSRALVPHPTLYGQGEDRYRGGAFPAYGRNVMREAAPAATAQVAAAARQATASRQAAAAAQAEAQSLDYGTRTAQAAVASRNALAGAEQRLARATYFSGVELQSASNQMRRHGTLTAEFITAAARGETTLREIGQQALVTAGKFGAWTLAATAIFGVVGALHEVGSGAIAASTGVNQLQRVVSNVNGDTLKEQFSGLAGQFNVPMDVATDAVYRMGQVFHDQTDAVTAAQAALYSYKTGEVDVATSTKNLIAVVNGFGLGANQLVDVYDQINAAQNKFGVSIGDTEAGLAKAAGTYRNAGGDLDYLLAVFVAIQKATSRSGQEIGTGISRGVNEIRKPINQRKLEAQGVTVNPENFQKTLQSALTAARRPDADLQQIASGLMGNQYARLIAPVLRDQTRLNQAIKDTSPEAAKNSAQKELATVLASVDEQIHRIGVNLQRLGSGLARAGLGDVPMVMLKGLNLVLSTAVKLVELFDKLPEGLRHGLTLLVQMGIVMAAMRRIGGLPNVANRTGLTFLSSEDRRLRTRAISGARGAEGEATLARERETQRAADQARRAEIELANARREQGVQDDMRRRGTFPRTAEEGGDHKEAQRRLSLDQKQLQLNERAVMAERAANEAAAEANVQRQIAIREAQRRRLLESASAAEVRAAYEASMLAAPRTMNVGELGGARTGADSRHISEAERALRNDLSYGEAHDPHAGRNIGVGQHSGLPMYLPLGQEIGEHSGLPMQTRQIDDAARRVSAFERNTKAWGQSVQNFGSRVGASNVAMRPVGALLGAAGTGLGRSASMLRGAGGGIRQIGGALRGLAGMLGPIDIGIIAIIAGNEVIKHYVDKMREHQAALSEYDKPVTSAKAFDAQTGRLMELGTQHDTAVQWARDHPNEAHSPWRNGPQDPFTGPDGVRLRSDYEVRKQLLATQQQQRIAGKPVPQMRLGEITKEISQAHKDLNDGIISRAEYLKILANAQVEIDTAYNQDDVGAKQRAQADLNAAKRGGAKRGDFQTKYGDMPTETLAKHFEATLAQFAGHQFDVGSFDFRDLTAQFKYLTERYINSDRPEDITALMEAQQKMYQGVEGRAQEDLQAALATAPNEAARRAAFRAQHSTVHQGETGVASKLVRDAKSDLDRDEAQLEKDQDLKARAGSLSMFTGLDAKIRNDLRNTKRDATVLRNRRKLLKEAQAHEGPEQAKIAAEELADRQQGRDITLALRQSRSTDSIQRADFAVRTARANLADARAHGNGRAIQQAETKLNEAEQSRQQAIVERINSLAQLHQAQVALRTGNDPVAMAQAAVADARLALAALRANHGDADQIIAARAQVLQLEASLAQTTYDEAQSLAQIRFQTAAARAGGSPEAMALQARQMAAWERGHARNRKERAQALLDTILANNQTEQVAIDAEQARYELLASQTTDPVEKANIQVNADRYKLRHAHGTTAKRQARAQLNNDLQARRDAALQSKEDDIDFNLEMEKISRQQAIDQYKHLLSMKNLTKQQRRDILRKIHGMEKESDSEASGFALAMGDIKLPTLYDVRRAIKGARGASNGGSSAKAEITNNVQVIVNDPKAADAVYEAMDRAMSTSVQATLRTAGLVM